MPELTDADRDAIKRAREALEEDHLPGPFGMSERIGQLEWHLREVLSHLERHGGA